MLNSRTHIQTLFALGNNKLDETTYFISFSFSFLFQTIDVINGLKVIGLIFAEHTENVYQISFRTRISVSVISIYGNPLKQSHKKSNPFEWSGHFLNDLILNGYCS